MVMQLKFLIFRKTNRRRRKKRKTTAARPITDVEREEFNLTLGTSKRVDKICSVYPWRHREPQRQVEMALVVTVGTGTSHITFEVLNLES